MIMYIATYIINLTALFYLLGFLHSSTALNNYRKKPFLIGIILTVIIIISEAVTILTENGNIDFRGINIFFNILGFALAPMIPVALTLILNRKIITTHRMLLIPTLINIIATVLSPKYRFIFYIDTNNQYIRGNYFSIFIIVYIVNFIFLVVSTFDLGKKYNYPIMQKLVALSLFTIMGTSIQIVEPLAYSSWHCVTLSLFLYFILMSEFDSSFDPLTGLYNRAAFDKAAKMMGGTKPFSVIILDINDFKVINDTYGHNYGDAVLKTVAEVIRKSFNKHYTCYRFGGDEFAIIGSKTDQEKIEYHLMSLTNAIEKIRNEDNPLPKISYGYSIYRGGENSDFYKNLKEADDRMYQLKKIQKQGDGSFINSPPIL